MLLSFAELIPWYFSPFYSVNKCEIHLYYLFFSIEFIIESFRSWHIFVDRIHMFSFYSLWIWISLIVIHFFLIQFWWLKCVQQFIHFSLSGYNFSNYSIMIIRISLGDIVTSFYF